jgi:uncharacterized tellurite resistance protein B-like protein
MKEIELIKKNLQQVIALAEKVGFENAYNFDLEDFTSTLENYLDELNEIGDFEIYSDEIDEGFIRINQLAGTINESQAKKLRQIIKEEISKASGENKSLKKYIEKYIDSINDFMRGNTYIENGNVIFTIPYTERFSSEDPAMPSKDVEGLINALQQNGIKIVKKGTMKEGGYKYTLITVNYDDLKNKIK